MLAGYSDWCAAVDLPERVPEVEHAALSRVTGTPVRHSLSKSVSLLKRSRNMTYPAGVSFASAAIDSFITFFPT